MCTLGFNLPGNILYRVVGITAVVDDDPNIFLSCSTGTSPEQAFFEATFYLSRAEDRHKTGTGSKKKKEEKAEAKLPKSSIPVTAGLLAVSEKAYTFFF